MPPTFRRKCTKTYPFTPYVFFPLPLFSCARPICAHGKYVWPARLHSSLLCRFVINNHVYTLVYIVQSCIPFPTQKHGLPRSPQERNHQHWVDIPLPSWAKTGVLCLEGVMGGTITMRLICWTRRHGYELTCICTCL